MMNPVSSDPSLHAAAYDTFEDFLRLAIKEYYERSGGLRKPNFVALLIASGQTMSITKDALGSTEGLKRLLLGTAGVMAARAILVRIISGPLGIVLTGVSLVSLIALLLRHQKEILGKVSRFRELIEHTRARFEDAQSGYRQNRMDAHERNLIVDGLLMRFIQDCEQI